MDPDTGPGTAPRVLVSACLMGAACRYDGDHSQDSRLEETLKGRIPLPVCPEQLGGLATPRAPARVIGGDGRAVLERGARVVDSEERDVTQNFVRGAEIAADLARRVGAVAAILKSKSPSCGLRYTEHGPGVLAALLIKMGFEIEELEGDH